VDNRPANGRPGAHGRGGPAVASAISGGAEGASHVELRYRFEACCCDFG
jgi:hypothetical protein